MVEFNNKKLLGIACFNADSHFPVNFVSPVPLPHDYAYFLVGILCSFFAPFDINS